MSRRRLFFRASGVDTDSFIMTVKTDNAGTSSSTQFTIPTIGIGYNYTVKTSDGQTITGNTGNLTITFPSAGTYDIAITGDFPRIYFNNGGDRLKLLEIKQWGTGTWDFNIAIAFNQGYFYGCSNLILSNCTDALNFGTSTNIGGMFYNCSSITTINNVNSWVMPSVPFLASHFFRGCTNFNDNIGAWDMSNCTLLGTVNGGFFQSCTNFNNGGSSTINNWDVTDVDNFANTFSLCPAFNQPLNSWNVSNGTNFQSMFNGCTNFNQNIGGWGVTNGLVFQTMFQNASSFNNGGSSDINNWVFASSGNINVQGMFQGASVFNQPLNNWNTTRFVTLNGSNLGMFRNALAFNQPLNNWVLINATSIRQMFSGATAFNQNIGAWQLTLATDALNFMNTKNTSTFSTTNLDAIYNGWTNASLQPSLSISFGTAKYTSASSEGRALLTRTNATVAITNAVNNGSGLIRISATAHGLSTGNKCFISGVVGTTEANGAWIVTVIDANTIDLQGSTFTNTYTSGGTLRTGYGWTITDGGI